MNDVISKERLGHALYLSEVVYNRLTHASTLLEEQGYTRVLPISRKGSDTEVLCGIKDRSAKIVFRGSSSLMDWIVDLNFIPAYRPLIHMGFGFSWHTVRYEIFDWLDDYWDDYDDISFYGHSLGGGIAQVAALSLAEKCHLKEVITFGAPRACFGKTATKYNQQQIFNSDNTLSDITFRVVNHADLVTRIPPRFIGYRHVGHVIFIDEQGVLHNHEQAGQIYRENKSRGFYKEKEEAEKEKKGVVDQLFTQQWWQKAPLLMFIWFIFLYFRFWVRFSKSGLSHLAKEYRPSIIGTNTSFEAERVNPEGMNELMGKVFMLTVGVGLLVLAMLGFGVLLFLIIGAMAGGQSF